MALHAEELTSCTTAPAVGVPPAARRHPPKPPAEPRLSLGQLSPAAQPSGHAGGRLPSTIPGTDAAPAGGSAAPPMGVSVKSRAVAPAESPRRTSHWPSVPATPASGQDMSGVCVCGGGAGGSRARVCGHMGHGCGRGFTFGGGGRGVRSVGGRRGGCGRRGAGACGCVEVRPMQRRPPPEPRPAPSPQQGAAPPQGSTLMVLSWSSGPGPALQRNATQRQARARVSVALPSGRGSNATSCWRGRGGRWLVGRMVHSHLSLGTRCPLSKGFKGVGLRLPCPPLPPAVCMHSPLHAHARPHAQAGGYTCTHVVGCLAHHPGRATPQP